ncbi:MAG TPA: hypothetical protein ENK40_05325 [Gammaproteobacteria bacterium]|nr:hypothetical protein [Gammaproteobacteria bacterium]
MPAPAIEKKREIFFSELHDDPNQADSARRMLEGLPGILDLQVVHPRQLNIQYDIHYHCLAEIEEALTEVGFRLDNNLLLRLKRALYRYTEATERANLGCPSCQDRHTRDIFIDHYQKQRHGCRDRRPDYWRDYL